MSEIIILANSWRPKGRCVAGIDVQTGEWVRPILKETHAIDESEVDHIELLDIVDIPFTGRKPKQPDKYQIENEYFKDYTWEVVGKSTKTKIKKYCENKGLILHSNSERVSPDILDKLKTSDWKSLQLIEVDATFKRRIVKNNKWRVFFADGFGNTMDLPLTDPVAYGELDNGKNLNGNCILTISLGQVYSDEGRLTPYCYKIVAGVIKI